MSGATTSRQGSDGFDAAGSWQRSDPPDWLSYDVVSTALHEGRDRVAAVIGRLHRPVRDEDELIQVMSAVVDLVVGASEQVLSASVTLAGEPQPISVATTAGAAAQLDQSQYAHDDGPCLRALRTSRPVTLARSQLEPVWPDLATLMGDLAVEGVASRPITPAEGEPAAGSLNLYLATRPSVPGTTERAQVEGLTAFVLAFAERALAEYLAVHRVRSEVRQLQDGLASRAVIEQAKGVLMADHGIDADAAFAALVRMSRSSNVKLREVARRLVDAAAGRQVAGPAGEGPAEAHGPSSRTDVRTAFEHALVGTALTDVDGTVLVGNQALVELLGVRAPDLVGTSLLSLTHPEDQPVAQASCDRLRLPEHRRSQVQVRFVRPDGTAVAASVLAAKVLHDDGRVSHLVMQMQALPPGWRASSQRGR